jgi:hypothetical protein
MDFEHIDHPILYYLLFVLAGIHILDILSTNMALMNPYNMEGNPLMAPLIPYAPFIKFTYILGAFVISDYIEHKHKRYGVLVLALICVMSFLIVANNILVLNGIYLFW